MLSASDLDAYFARIGYAGPRTPTLDVLRAISHAHVHAVPFENLDVLLGRPIALDVEALLRKVVHERRGGYCFELNGLLLHALEALGFCVTPLSARVRLQRPRDFTPPRTHMFLKVDVGGDMWLADVGVGAASLAAPIRFDAPGEQPTPHEPRRIVSEGDRRFHQMLRAGEWMDVYEFTGEMMPPIDREVANWYTSAHPKSHFRETMMVARALPGGGRATLLNAELTIRGRDGAGDARTLDSPKALLDALAEHFDLRFPAGTRFGAPGVPWPT
jgi:N-hydroxyarylamine O-acetyltransferase